MRLQTWVDLSQDPVARPGGASVGKARSPTDGDLCAWCCSTHTLAALSSRAHTARWQPESSRAGRAVMRQPRSKVSAVCSKPAAALRQPCRTTARSWRLRPVTERRICFRHPVAVAAPRRAIAQHHSIASDLSCDDLRCRWRRHLRRKNRPRRRWCRLTSRQENLSETRPVLRPSPGKAGEMSAGARADAGKATVALRLAPATEPRRRALPCRQGRVGCWRAPQQPGCRFPAPEFSGAAANAPVPRSPFWGSGCQCRCKARQRPRCPAGQLLLPPGRLGAVRAPQGFLSVSLKPRPPS